MVRLALVLSLLAAVLAATANAVGPTPGQAPVLTVGDVSYTARVQGFDTMLTVPGASRKLAGTWGFPRVAYDGSVEGLSVDGKTLVLSEIVPNLLQSPSRFLVLAPETLATRRLVSLRGKFAFDAMSPNGKRMYLVEYVTVLGQLRYRVRAYDTSAGKLLKQVIADKRSGWTTMEGMPISRATSDGGTWIYTLYGSSKKTFVHALNAAQGYALCIDLPLATQNVRRLRLDGGRLSVVGDAERELAAIDTASLQVVHS